MISRDWDFDTLLLIESSRHLGIGNHILSTKNTGNLDCTGSERLTSLRKLRDGILVGMKAISLLVRPFCGDETRLDSYTETVSFRGEGEKERTTDRGDEANSEDGADHDDGDANVRQDLLRGEVSADDKALARIMSEAMALVRLHSGKLDVLH